MSPVFIPRCHQQGVGMSRGLGWVCPGDGGGYVERRGGESMSGGMGIPGPILYRSPWL